MTGGGLFDGLLMPGFVVINVAYATLLVGAFARSMHRIRLLLVGASAFFVGYGLLLGIVSMVVWNLIIGGLHLHRLLVALWSDACVRLTAEQKAVRRRLFPDLSPRAFRHLWELSEELVCVDDALVAEGEAADRLYLVLRGWVQVERDQLVLDRLGPGSVFGSLDLVPFHGPTADCRAAGPVWLRRWKLADVTDPDVRQHVVTTLGGGRAPATGVLV